jgi:carboxypeptidase Taq
VDPDLRTLKERVAEITDLYSSLYLLDWDQKVTMPPGGHPARAEAMATIGRIAHEKFVDAETGLLLERLQPLEESLDYDSDEASLIRVARRDWEKQRRVPTELRAEMIRSAALGNQVWIEARATNDFPKFLPALRRNLELKRRYVECFEWDDSPYTPLLDDFEPYATTAEVTEVFGQIRPVLAELVREAPKVDLCAGRQGRWPMDSGCQPVNVFFHFLLNRLKYKFIRQTYDELLQITNLFP